MSYRDKIEQSLALVIPSCLTREMNKRDLQKLLKSYSLMEEATKALLSFEITPDEYCQLCEQHEINVDSYMQTVENNLMQLQLV